MCCLWCICGLGVFCWVYLCLCCSKLSAEIVDEACKAVKAGQKRNFLESVEVQIGLRDYDPQRDKRFAGTVRLPYAAAPNKRICVLGDAEHCEEAKKAGLACMSIEDMKALNKNNKEVKKLAKKYDAFLASQTILPQIPRLLGPGLNKAGKFPTLLTHNEKLEDKVRELKASIKFQLKKVLCLGVAIGNVDMTEEEIKANLLTAINFLVSLLKKNWNNVKTLTIKTTMGKPQRIYG